MPSYLDEVIRKAKRVKESDEAEENAKPVKEKKEVKFEELKEKGIILEKPKKKPVLREKKIDELEEKLFGAVKNKGEREERIAAAREEERKESAVESELKQERKELIDSYGDVKIYRVPEKSVLYYIVPVSKPTIGERTIITTIKEAATRLISIAPYRIRDAEQRRTVYKQKILEILNSSRELNIPERRFDFYAESVVREMVGYGMIDPLVRDDRLEEIMVIGAKKPVYAFHREHEMMVTNIEFISDNEITDLINRIAREVGRRVDISAPLLDARLADGSRVNATIPPASISGASLTIRKFREDPYSIVDLINMKTLGFDSAAFLWLCVDGLGVKPANILITGGTGSGKTTTLNVLASFIPERERIVTIEDTAELNLPLNHIIRLEARPPGLEGTGEISLEILTKNSLRMRPDRIIVGEVRHKEAFTLFTALNTGHDGSESQDTLIQFEDGAIREIGEFAEEFFSGNHEIKKEKGFEYVELKENYLKVLCVNKRDLKQRETDILRVWRKKVENEKTIRIKTASGKSIELSNDHPVFRLKNGFVEQIHARDCEKGDSIAVANQFTIKGRGKETAEAYLVGLILGDGHLREDVLEFTNNDEGLHEEFRKRMEKAFEINPKKIHRKDRIRSKIFSVDLCKKLNSLWGIPTGNKTRIFNVPKKIEKSGNAVVGEFLKGLYDCEGHVSDFRPTVFFSTTNKNLVKKIPLLFKRFGIQTRLNVQEKDGKGNIGPYYRICINGKNNLGLFYKFIGFNHKGKQKSLKKWLKLKSNTNVDLVPGTGKIIKRIREFLKLSKKQLALDCGFGKTGSTINAYEFGKRQPSRNALNKLNEIFTKKFNAIARKNSFASASEALEVKKLIMHLNSISSKTVFWDKITETRKEASNSMHYDLTLRDYHTYVANGLIVSNCLGTVHANSPQETIVRVTSPPMNVPEVMLSGLDFIVVEHRIHDRKKGTIRRITEIAEVTGVLEGKTAAQTIWERDPIKDEIRNTGIQCNYLKTLMRFTGYSKKQIDDELRQREKVLRDLVKNNIRSMPEACAIMQNYLMQKSVL